MSKKIVAIAVSAALFSFAATAQTPPPAQVPGGPPPTPTAPPRVAGPQLTADEQAYLATEAEMVKTLHLLELQAQIADTQRKITGEESKAPPAADAVIRSEPVVISRSPVPQARGASVPQRSAPAKRASDLPFSLLSVWGVDGDFKADLFSGGLRLTVREGDALPDGWRLSNIARTGIQIKKKGARTRTLMVGE